MDPSHIYVAAVGVAGGCVHGIAFGAAWCASTPGEPDRDAPTQPAAQPAESKVGRRMLALIILLNVSIEPMSQLNHGPSFVVAVLSASRLFCFTFHLIAYIQLGWLPPGRT